MDGSLISQLVAIYGAGVVPTGIVAWLLITHVRDCSERRQRIYEAIDELRKELTAKVDAATADLHWIRGKLERDDG